MDDIVQLEDGVTAIQYGTPEGQWEPKALIKVAAFVTGIDLTKDAITEDQLLDVVAPSARFWNPSNNMADIDVFTGERTLGMTLGQWLVKYADGSFRVLSTNDYLSQVGPSKPALSFRQELQQLLNKHSIDAEVEMHDFVLAKHIDRYLKSLAVALAETKKLKES